MQLPFTLSYQKENFKGTFLYEVSFKIFLPENLGSIPFEKMGNFFHKLFGLDLLKPQYERALETKIEVRSIDGGIEYEIASESIKVTILQNYYASFNASMVPVIEKLVDAYSLLFGSCQKLEMKYVDLWTVPSNDFPDDQMALLKDALFSPQLKNASNSEDFNIDYAEFTDDNAFLKIKYGYGSNLSGNRNIALESRCGISSPSGIKNVCILDEAKKINRCLYSAFIWSVSPAVLDAMRNPK